MKSKLLRFFLVMILAIPSFTSLGVNADVVNSEAQTDVSVTLNRPISAIPHSVSSEKKYSGSLPKANDYSNDELLFGGFFLILMIGLIYFYQKQEER